MIKDLINKLKKESFLSLRPEYEWEISNTYPISVLPSWEKCQRANVENALRYAPNHSAKIYVHIPFCTQKCSYCFYQVSASKNFDRQKRYIEHLKKEMSFTLEKIGKEVNVESCYFGGGTPTALDKDLLSEILIFTKVNFPLRDYIWTVEVSPETANVEKLALLKRAGVNRVSMGVQCLDDNVLKRIHRAHDAISVIRAIKRVTEYNFSIFNVDLIYGLPSQSMDSWEDTVSKIVDLHVPEITLYHLRANPCAIIKKRAVSLKEELMLFFRANDILRKGGYIRVRPHHWVLAEYHETWKRYKAAPTSDQRFRADDMGFVLGFGVSAISHLGNYLYINKSKISEYCDSIDKKSIPADREFELKLEDRYCRFFINKLVQGMKVDTNEFENFFKCLVPQNIWKVIVKLCRLGLVEQEKNILRLTEEGLLVFDLIERLFYPKKYQ